MGQPARRWIPALVLGSIALGLALHALAWSFVCDDAYISFRYSYNLAYHGELTFNPGQRVEGYTNFLWTVLIGLLLKLRLRPEITSQVLGIFFGSASLALLYWMTRIYRGGLRTGWDFLGPMFLAASAGFAVWCSGGLETQMFTALALGGVTLYVAEHRGKARGRWSGLLFALASLTRPEGMMLFALSCAHRFGANIIGERRLLPNRGELAWVAGYLVPFALFFWWRYAYYGHPLPNTFYVKADGSSIEMIKRWGLPYLWDFIHHNKLYVLVALFVLFRPTVTGFSRAERRARETLVGYEHQRRGTGPAFVWSYLVLIVVCYATYVVRVGGDFMALGRFFVPIFPLLAFAIQEGLRESIERFPRPAQGSTTWRPWRMALTATILVALSVANSAWLYQQNSKMAYYRWGLDTVAYLRKFADDRIVIGTWMRQNLPRETYISVGGAGAVVYASRLKTLDAFGLSDSWIAHNVKGQGQRPGHSKFAPEHYVLREKPDLICHIGHHQDQPYRPNPGEKTYWRSRGYHWACLDPPGLRPRYYCCLKRLDRDLGPLSAQRDS
jgi:hypothetical protein